MQTVAVWKWSCSEQHKDVRVRNLLSVKTTAVKPSASKTPLKSCTTTTTTSHVIFLLFHFEVGNGRVIILARFCPEWLAGPEPEPVILLVIPVWGGGADSRLLFLFIFCFFPHWLSSFAPSPVWITAVCWRPGQEVEFVCFHQFCI